LYSLPREEAEDKAHQALQRVFLPRLPDDQKDQSQDFLSLMHAKLLPPIPFHLTPWLYQAFHRV
jgi:hypothetical protein